jgi:hypothetical protein
MPWAGQPTRAAAAPQHPTPPAAARRQPTPPAAAPQELPRSLRIPSGCCSQRLPTRAQLCQGQTLQLLWTPRWQQDSRRAHSHPAAACFCRRSRTTR